MEVTIECSCGTRYGFDVEPENGQMPSTIQCPDCGVDGTTAANEFIAGQLADAEPAVLQPTMTPPSVPMYIPSANRKPKKKQRGYGEPNIMMGTVGAVVAGFIAMIVWFLIIKATNTEIGIIAWGVGGVIGFGCRTLSGGYSQSLGVIAAVSALVAIIGGQYLATKSYYDDHIDEILVGAYDAYLSYAQRAQQLETDQDIRLFLATEWSDEDEQFTPESFTQEEIDEFRNTTAPSLKEVVNGNPSREQYEDNLRGVYNSASMKGIVLKESLSLWTLLWLFLGVGTAYRLGTGETE